MLPHKHARRITTPLLLLVAVMMAVPYESAAQGSYNNATIATDGLAYIGQVYDPGYPGSCWPFVRDMIYKASSGTQDVSAAAGGGDYFAHLQNAGGVQITDVNQLVEGDVVQIGEFNTGSQHTFIIVAHGSGNTFTIVDANHDGHNTVMERQATVTLGSSERAYRFGSVPSTAPPPHVCGKLGDINCDGSVNIFDLSILLNHYTSPPASYYPSADLNCDGLINVFDLSLLMANYGK